MITEDPWDLLRTGSAEQGLSIIRERYARDASPSHIMELGVAYMWLADYRAASDHFQNSARTSPTPTEDFLGFAGAAEWCLDNYSTAVGLWRAGLNAAYAAEGVCSRSPMLLLLASILRPELLPRREAEEMLVEKAKNPRLKFWPGTLAQFMAGQIDRAALEASWVGNVAKYVRGVMPHAKWLTQFYEEILEFGRGGLSLTGVRTSLRFMVDLSHAKWSEHFNFVHLLWNPEFFIARHEAQWAERV